MSHATKTLADELAYLRTMHTEASRRSSILIANSIAADIADLVRAMEVLAKLDTERAEAA